MPYKALCRRCKDKLFFKLTAETSGRLTTLIRKHEKHSHNNESTYDSDMWEFGNYVGNDSDWIITRMTHADYYQVKHDVETYGWNAQRRELRQVVKILSEEQRL